MAKVVTPQEIKRLEKLALERGLREEDFISSAGFKVAEFICRLKPKKVAILAGKGNNGADGFATAIELLKRGVETAVFALYPASKSSRFNLLFRKAFEKRGAVLDTPAALQGFDLIVDAIFGIGFQGVPDEKSSLAIDLINKSGIPTVAIDIPSGLDAAEGVISSVAIKASYTLSMGLYKSGYFLNDGWEQVGRIELLDFGFPEDLKKEAKPLFFASCKEEARQLLPKIKRVRHKYEAGSVIGFAGSLGMIGAAKLSSLASLRSGAGMMRLFLPKGLEEASFTFPKEVVTGFWQNEDIQDLLLLIKKADALFIGPGMGRDEKVRVLLETLLPQIDKPLVLDGDALYFLKEGLKLPSHTILTPHAKEMERLLNGKPDHLKVQAYCEKSGVIIVLKGAPTFIFAPFSPKMVVPYGDPGMATAGSGDVLTGIIASFLAQGVDPYASAMLGATVHALCGELTAEEKGSASLIASDLIKAIPQVFKLLK